MVSSSPGTAKESTLGSFQGQPTSNLGKENAHHPYVMATPESLRLGTSSFGPLKDSAYSKADDGKSDLMQSSINVIFERPTAAFNSNRSAQQKPEQSYNKIQNNLKSLQDKIRDLECKLSSVNPADEPEHNVSTSKPKSILKPRLDKSPTSRFSHRRRSS